MLSFEELRRYYSGRRVLVTGSTGFKGSWLCRTLALLGAEVTGYALEPPTIPSLWREAGLKDCVHQITADVRDIGVLHSAFAETHPQTVFHLAAQPLVLESYERPRHTYEVNVMGTVNLLDCVCENPSVTSVVNVTTDKVYENLEVSGHAFVETERLDGFDPYSNSKSCSELITSTYVRSFLAPSGWGDAAGRCAVSTARAGNVIGGGDFAAKRIIPDCVKVALAGETLVLRNPDSIRPYQHVLEPVCAYILLAAMQDADRSLAGPYNIGPDREDCITTGMLANMFSDAWGEGFSWEVSGSGGPHEAGLLMLDTTKAHDLLGWRSRWGVSKAIQRTVDWTRAWKMGYAREEMDAQIFDYLGELV